MYYFLWYFEYFLTIFFDGFWYFFDDFFLTKKLPEFFLTIWQNLKKNTAQKHFGWVQNAYGGAVQIEILDFCEIRWTLSYDFTGNQKISVSEYFSKTHTFWGRRHLWKNTYILSNKSGFGITFDGFRVD